MLGPPPNILVCSPPSLAAGTFFSLKTNLDALYGHQVTISYKAVFASVVPGHGAGLGLSLAHRCLRPGWQ